jgi:hypothetical protein
MPTAASRPKRGKKALKAAAKDLGYEWLMVRSSVQASLAAAARRDGVAKNIALERFLLHARNIRDFFRANGRRDDVLARDFLGTPIRVRMPVLRSRTIGTRLNRRVAHLSHSRARLGRRWPVSKLLAEIENAMTRFEQRLREVDPKLADILIGAV